MVCVLFVRNYTDRLTRVDRISSPNESSCFAPFDDGPEIVLQVLVVARTESNP